MEHSWEFEIFMDDQGENGPASPNIPDTKVPAFSAWNNQADDYSFRMYNKRGFSVLQNLAANIVLKLESGNMDASIDALNMPFGHDET